MKLFIALVSLVCAHAALASDTAYSVLRVIGKQKGQNTLNQVLELRGRNGAPQPVVWKVVLAEPGARGGVREVEVQAGKIIGERTPTNRKDSGAPMDFNRLNLDSDGLFTVVNQEMQQDRVPFDRLDYVLRSGSGGGAPVWSVELFDGKRGRVASMQVAADSGSILAKVGASGPRIAGPSSDRDYVQPGPDAEYLDEEPPQKGRVTVYTEGGQSHTGEPFRNVPDFFNRLGKRFQKRGQQLENFFTGRSHSSTRERFDEE